MPPLPWWLILLPGHAKHVATAVVAATAARWSSLLLATIVRGDRAAMLVGRVVWMSER